MKTSLISLFYCILINILKIFVSKNTGLDGNEAIFNVVLKSNFFAEKFLPRNYLIQSEDKKTNKDIRFGSLVEDFNIRCIWITDNFNVYDLSPLQRANDGKDIQLKINDKEEIYTSFCRNLDFNCGNKTDVHSQMIYKNNKEECKVLAGPQENYNKWEQINMTNPFEGLHITFNSGEPCNEQGSNITNYSVDIFIICDYQNKTTSPIEFLPEYFSNFKIDKCRNTLVAVSKSGCPVINIFMLSKFIEQYKEVLGAVAILIGIFMLTFGNKFLKITFVIILIIASCSVALYFYYYLPIDKSKDFTLWITLGVGLIFGLVLGYFLIKIESIIYFCIGGYLGFLLGNMIYTATLIHIKSNLVLPITLVICIILCGYISFLLSKHLIIITSSIIGAYAVIRGASLYIGHFPNESVIIDLIENHEFDQLKMRFDKYFIAYCVALLVLIISGIYIQYKTSKDDKEKVNDQRNNMNDLYNYRRA